MHERTIAASARNTGDAIELVSPQPGWFRIGIQVGDSVRPGSILGELEVLGQPVVLVAPATGRGVVTAICAHDATRPPVDAGTVVATLDPRATIAATEAEAAAFEAAATGLSFVAPTSGRFYGRAAPDKPAFVAVGTELSAGTTICLLEVMKTFHRVTYAPGGGVALPERARVTRVLVADGDDVNAGDPLLSLEPF
jgi:acetyl-CoA carboxylase biotin carboxyl carrier protein